ncbi:hypothetical protein [Desulfonauticus submarinus]
MKKIKEPLDGDQTAELAREYFDELNKLNGNSKDNALNELGLLAESANDIVYELMEALIKTRDELDFEIIISKAKDWLTWYSGETTAINTAEDICKRLTGEKLYN